MQPCQRKPRPRQQESSCQGPLGEMASCLDDGLGTGSSPQREIELFARIGKGQEFRLGRLAQTILEAPQQQEIQGYRLVPEVGRGR